MFYFVMFCSVPVKHSSRYTKCFNYLTALGCKDGHCSAFSNRRIGQIRPATHVSSLKSMIIMFIMKYYIFFPQTKCQSLYISIAGRVPGNVAFHAYMSADRCFSREEVVVFDVEVSIHV